MNREIFLKTDFQPVCVGTGLVTLDIVIKGDSTVSPHIWAGGSCGNVLSILSYLGWRSIPVIRLGKDEAAKTILEDWRQFNIVCDNIEQDRTISTPIIVEKIHISDNGNPAHRFFWTCPNCGAWLPRYRPIRISDARRAFSQLVNVNCFYFDRVSPASLELASQFKKAGALVVFEPPSIKDNDLIRKAVNICHILKYANNRVRDEVNLAYLDGPILIIETLGECGIRYLFQSQKVSGRWNELPAFSVKDFRDACGSGDWCTAGIIYKLGKNGSNGLENLTENNIIEALKLGQAMAALNCYYEGARGGMYVLERDEFNKAIKRILDNQAVNEASTNKVPKELDELFLKLCPGCRKIK